MPIVGFNFTKLNIEKTADLIGKINITNNIQIKDIQKLDIALGKEKKPGLKFVFAFLTEYKQESAEKNIGKLDFEGEITYMGEEKHIKDIESNWKKDKKLNPEIMKFILNMALDKSNIEAIVLTDKVNLPPPIPLPKVTIEKPEEIKKAK